MAIDIPTTKEVSDNIIAQLEASLSQTIPLLPKSFNRVLAKALAGVCVVLYKYTGFVFLQLFVRTASGQETEINGQLVTPLTAWGRLVGVGDPLPAVQAELRIAIQVIGAGTLPAGTALIGDNGITYLTLQDVTLVVPVVEATVRASGDQNGGNGAGAIGNTSKNEDGSVATLNFANALPNVLRLALVFETPVVAGEDAETTEAYRQRVLDRFQKRPQGGAYADYEFWGEEPTGIVNVYPYTSANPGQVDVYVEATPESSGNDDGIPTADQLQQVLDSIELDSSVLATRRPAGALVNAFAISRTVIDVNINGLTVGNQSETRANIESALTEYLLEREPYIAGLSVPPRKDQITRSSISGVVDDVVSAAGGSFLSVIVSENTNNFETYSLSIGEKLKLGVVKYV